MNGSGRPSLLLTDEVQYLPGVGPWRAALLRKLGIHTAGDLLEYLPVRHERNEARTIENLDEGITATIVGQITAISARRTHQGPTISATLTDNTGRCRLRWFNAKWVTDRLERGVVIRATGKVREFRQAPQMVNPRFDVLGADAEPVDESAPALLDAIYPATAELSSRTIGHLILSNLDRLLPLVEEWYPPAYLKERDLAPRRWALSVAHRPRVEAEVARARRRLAYDELLLMQVAISLSRHHRRIGLRSPGLKCNAEIDRRIRRRFPFPLTRAQDRAVDVIANDLARARPMNRLLQGDVGCGKTVVALYAALIAVANRWQVAIMAPTELLAEQHYRSIDKYLAESRVRYGLLVGGLPAAERRMMLERIESAEMDIVVGTHALIQKDVRFARLGLVVVDEQHRFGVRQRATIRGKALAPHYLVMTATPIPRTLAMTAFGDLDVTTIEELPPGRSGIETRVVGPRRHDLAWQFVRSRLDAGEQAYVVYPLVDESDKMVMRAATTEYRRLDGQVFASWRVGLLHGRMKTAERDAVMGDFMAGRIRVLVATTVVEVGIDVSNATCMVIEHAERYGLSQLHQLRGRVGRGSRKGYCFLMTDSPEAVENERLNALARTTDGFKIAEEDLRLRGPGEMLGTRQHGLPALRVADLLRDGELLRGAQRDAGQMVRGDPQLRRPELRVLRSMLVTKYRDVIGLMDVG
ncbi:MAG: ATP-dependent DNA helicase RecG [Phycisphaerae bacterium]|nr:ATP-dependent DNA helicase RecG [Phycisphaerae bacterium]